MYIVKCTITAIEFQSIDHKEIYVPTTQTSCSLQVAPKPYQATSLLFHHAYSIIV